MPTFLTPCNPPPTNNNPSTASSSNPSSPQSPNPTNPISNQSTAPTAHHLSVPVTPNYLPPNPNSLSSNPSPTSTLTKKNTPVPINKKNRKSPTLSSRPTAYSKTQSTPISSTGLIKATLLLSRTRTSSKTKFYPSTSNTKNSHPSSANSTCTTSIKYAKKSKSPSSNTSTSAKAVLTSSVKSNANLVSKLEGWAKMMTKDKTMAPETTFHRCWIWLISPCPARTLSSQSRICLTRACFQASPASVCFRQVDTALNLSF